MDLLNIYTILLSGDLESLSTLESPIPTVDLLDISPEKINQMSDESIRKTPQNLEDFINPKLGNLQRFQFGNPVNFNPVDISTQKLRSIDLPENFPSVGEVTNTGSTNRLTETPIFQDKSFDQIGVEPLPSINTINNTTNTSNNTEEKNFYFQIKLDDSPNTESTSINQNSFLEIFTDGNNFMTKLENISSNISMLDKTNPQNSIKPILDNLITPQQNTFPSDLISTLNSSLYSVVGDITNSDETRNVIRNVFQQNNAQETINQIINSNILQKSLDEINKIPEVYNNQRNISEAINQIKLENISSNISMLDKTNPQNSIKPILDNLITPQQNTFPSDLISTLNSSLYSVVGDITNSDETRNVIRNIFQQNNTQETINQIINSNILQKSLDEINKIPEVYNNRRNISETINQLTTGNLININNSVTENLPNTSSDFSKTTENSLNLEKNLENITNKMTIENISDIANLEVNNLLGKNTNSIIPQRPSLEALESMVGRIDIISPSFLEISGINKVEPRLAESNNVFTTREIETNRVDVEPMAPIRTNPPIQVPQVIREEPQIPIFQPGNNLPVTTQPQNVTTSQSTPTTLPVMPEPNISTVTEKKGDEMNMSNQMLGSLLSQLGALTSVVREISTKLSYLDEDTNLSFK